MKSLASIAFAVIILVAMQACASLRQTAVAKHYYLFSYFTGQNDGARLAVSEDGKSWQPINRGEPIVRPGSGDVLRDPSIQRGDDGVYRMVWTTGWTGNDIGLSTSTDLVHWTPIQKLPVMAGVSNVGHCWAPEIFFERKAANYILYWSSNVDIWSIFYTTTRDFKTFSPPKILFSNGERGGGKAGNNGPIDAYIFDKTAGSYILFYKKDDNTGVPNIFWRAGGSPLGPWGAEEGPLTPSTGDEGPSVVNIAGTYRVYTDPFESDKAYVYSSKDLKHWQREITDLTMSHGSILEIDERTWRRLAQPE